MSLFEVGRLCLKLAGRDAGRKCVVVEDAKEGYVVVDGDVRRKKVNIKHLEPLAEVVELKSSSHEAVKKTFETLGLKVWERKSKKPAERPKKVKKVVPKKEAKPKKEEKGKKAEKKEEKLEKKSETKKEEKAEGKKVKEETKKDEQQSSEKKN